MNQGSIKSLEAQESELTSEIEILLDEANSLLELVYSKEKKVAQIRKELNSISKEQITAA